MTHLMIDLETLGISPMAAPMSIGIVEFTPDEILKSFYFNIDIDSSIQAGLKIDASTVKWWLSQDYEARDSITSQKTDHSLADIISVLDEICTSDTIVWSNGASFDIAIIESACKLLNRDAPWKFWNTRCYRTMKNLRKDIKCPEPEIDHHAEYDAIAQAKHLQLIWKALS